MAVLLKYAVTLFKLLGYWPLETKNRTALFFNKIYFYLTLTTFILITLGMSMEIPNAAKCGLKKFVDNISISAQFTYGLIKLFCLSLPIMRSLQQKIIVTENNILASNNVGVKEIYMKYAKLNHKVAEIWIAVVVVNGIAFSISPWIVKLTDPSEDLTLPLNSYFPFDYHNYFKTTYVFVIIEGTVATMYLTLGNTLYVGVIIFIISQLAILKHEIAEGIDTIRFTNEEIHQNLRNIAMYYQNISKFVNDFDQVIKYLNLIYFLICIGHTSMIGFEIITDDFSFQLIKNIWYLLGSLIADLLTWYTFANAITLKQADLLNVLWESDWYNCSIKNKKTILMIMLQFKRPLKLSVGFSYAMSLETMVMMLRMSISYMITLKQFYAMKEAI